MTSGSPTRSVGEILRLSATPCRHGLYYLFMRRGCALWDGVLVASGSPRCC